MRFWFCSKKKKKTIFTRDDIQSFKIGEDQCEEAAKWCEENVEKGHYSITAQSVSDDGYHFEDFDDDYGDDDTFDYMTNTVVYIFRFKRMSDAIVFKMILSTL